jgi:hypothetical protein
LEGTEKLLKRNAILKLTQTRSIGAADVDGDQVGVGVDLAQTLEIVFGGLLVWSDFAFSEAYHDRNGERQLAPQIESKGMAARVIESEAVDDRLLLGETE